ncbi:MAG: HTTM domain-containing protein [Fluviicola sp.]|nr:HTTM domain-containing protein [Fluviicola sp.]
MDSILILYKNSNKILLIWYMILVTSFIKHIQTGKGLLFLLVVMIIVWLCGYNLIDAITTDSWTRYLRQLFFSRFTLIIFLTCLFFAYTPLIKSFISDTKKTATDLSVFRILFFGFFAIGFIFNPTTISDQVLPFLNLPDSAQVPLPFMGWYLKIIPINETIVSIVSVVFYITIFTSLFGVKTRWSIVLFTLTLFYLFAIPNFYGKVNHNHHLIWFPAILAFSPCADRFSIDAYFRKRANNSIVHSTRSYSLPFLLIWTLIGLIYFFPGFWKMWTNGLDWSLTDNVRNQMYYKWFALGDKSSWIPIFRIDHYPFLYKAIGIFTIIFELSFIPLLLNKTTRKLAIVFGIGFHIGTLIFMNIFFVVLVWSYLSFVNWNTISFLREPDNSTDYNSSNFNFSAVKWIGIILISTSIFFGFSKLYSWPFTAYPTFDAIVKEDTYHLVYVATAANGKEYKLSNSPLHTKYTSPRYWSMEFTIIQSTYKNELDSTLLDHLTSVFMKKSKEITEIDIYLEKQSIVPEKRNRSTLELIYSKTFN